MDRAAGSDGDLPDLAVTAESESKSKSKIRQSFQGLIQCQWGRGEGSPMPKAILLGVKV
jgi:hypothetical protein